MVKTKPLPMAILLDLLTGLLATGLFALFTFYSFGWRGIGTLFAATGLLFISAGFLRGISLPTHAGLKALLLVSPFVIVFSFFIPATRFYLVTQAVGALLASLAGIYARQSWAAGVRDRAALILGVTLGLFEIASILGAPILAERMTTRTVDVPAPAFTAQGLNGRVVDSSQFKGRVTVLYFWASWCPVCRQELPKLEKLFQCYELDSNVSFLAIDDTSRNENLEDAKNFVNYYAPGIPVALDDWYAAARFQVRVIPTLVILDRSWHVRLVHTGYDGSEHYVGDLSKEIGALLAGQ